MSGWAAYLAPLDGVAAGAAIISLQGAECGKKGDWKASAQEQQQWAQYWSDLSQANAKGLFYNKAKNIVVRAADDTILASLGKEGLILQKAKTVFVAARYVEGQVPNSVSAKVGGIVQQLIDAGC
jgi:hypothetical protein